MKIFSKSSIVGMLLILFLAISLRTSTAYAATNVVFPLPADNVYWASVLDKYSSGKVHPSYIGEYIFKTGPASLPKSVVDIAADEGTPVLAVADGVVYENNSHTYGGFNVVIRHDDGSFSYYGHLLYRSSLKVGTRVSMGQEIGKVGMSGAATGPHLHFELSGFDVFCGFRKMGYNLNIMPDSGASRHPHYCCDHEYAFKNDTMLCIYCGEEYALKFIPTGEYMDVSAVNRSSKTAPSHRTPYGDATIVTRFKKNETVFVKGYVENAFGNRWYQLSTNDYLNEDYLSAHKCKKSSCEVCTAGLDMVSFSTPITLSVKNKSYVYHYAPYEDSKEFSKWADVISVDGKLVNRFGNVWYHCVDGSYVYSSYVSTPTSTGYISLKSDTLAMNNRPCSSSNGQSKMLAELQPNTIVTVYTNETVGSWYSVKANVNGKSVVGFVYKSYVSMMETKKEISDSMEICGSVTSGTSGNITNLTATPTPVPKASVLWPTNNSYLKKYSVGTNNATLVTNITKEKGTNVTEVGLSLYENGNLIKTYRENVTGVVGKNTTSFHTWVNVAKEVGVTLKSQTPYSYRFYTVVDGIRYEGATYWFTTK